MIGTLEHTFALRTTCFGRLHGSQLREGANGGNTHLHSRYRPHTTASTAWSTAGIATTRACRLGYEPEPASPPPSATSWGVHMDHYLHAGCLCSTLLRVQLSMVTTGQASLLPSLKIQACNLAHECFASMQFFGFMKRHSRSYSVLRSYILCHSRF
jgi:hypothetical protein